MFHVIKELGFWVASRIASSIRINIRTENWIREENQTWNRPKILVSSRTGPGTASKIELVLEPDPDPSHDLSPS